MEAPEVYRLRVVDLGRQWESVRTIEWKTHFQTYLGYAGIATAYSVVREKYPLNVFVYIAVFATAILWAATLYLSLGIQRRLHSLYDEQQRYFALLHETTNAKKLSITIEPRWWAFSVQLLLSTVAASAIVMYVVVAGNAGSSSGAIPFPDVF